MKKEFLKELGLTDEQIEKVFAEHGKAINAEKEKANEYKTKYEDVQGSFRIAIFYKKLKNSWHSCVSMVYYN